MANGEVTITFDGVNLDNCIKQGLEITGRANCPNCKQIYTFQIQLSVRDKIHKYIDTEMNGKTITTPVPDSYDVSIEFAKPREPQKKSDFSHEIENADDKEKCDPCSGCTPGCERL